MKIELINKKLSQIKADCEIVFVVGKKIKHKWIKDGAILKKEDFQGKPEESLYLSHKKKLYLGIESLKADDVRIGAAQAVRILKKKCQSIKIGVYGDGVKPLAEGFLLGAYEFRYYKSKPGKDKVSKVLISIEDYDNKKVDLAMAKKDIREAQIISEATNLTRDIVNTIPADITPVKLAEIAKDLAKKNNLKIKVQGDKFLEKEGMNAFLAVSKASPYPAQLIHLEYKPAKSKKKIILVGKGLTYDSGGLSLKPTEGMVTMKSDKSGASAILGIMQVVSKLKLPFEIHGIIGATENMPGQHAYKPGDVVKAKNGKTIEVRNTDAEGRLVLADCLVYAQELKPDYLVDLATLTGAVMYALGEYTVGVMGFDEKLKNSIISAGEKSGELSAGLPFNRFMPKLIKSEIADIINTATSKYGGAITAALFLAEFIEKKYKDKWIHLDIAGPSFVEKPWGYNPHGASGSGVRLILEWLKQLDSDNKT